MASVIGHPMEQTITVPAHTGPNPFGPKTRKPYQKPVPALHRITEMDTTTPMKYVRVKKVPTPSAVIENRLMPPVQETLQPLD